MKNANVYPHRMAPAVHRPAPGAHLCAPQVPAREFVLKDYVDSRIAEITSDRRVVITGLDGRFYTMTVLADGRLQLDETDDPGIGGWTPPEIDLTPYDRKYSLVSATIADGTVSLQDRAVNAIRLGSDVTECTFIFPDRIKGKARDFMLRLEIVGEEPPSLYFDEPDGSHVNFDYTDEDWAAVEQGVNVFMFSDTKEGE